MVSIKTLYIEESVSNIIQIECDSAPGIPGIVFSGRAGKIIEESAIRVRQAIRNTFDISFVVKILINLIPADIKKNTNLFDLPLAIAILGALNKISFSLNEILILGELSLSGQISTINSVIPHLLRANSLGFKYCIIPDEDIPENLHLPVSIKKVKNLFETWELISKLFLKKPENANVPDDISIKSKETNDYLKRQINYCKTTFKDNLVEESLCNNEIDYDFKDYVGGLYVKRALTICAAGFHSIYLLGPSGTGKTLLSTMFKNVLPPILKKELYEIIDLYSQFNITFETKRLKRPYRVPHHSSTVISMVGGGNPLTIGEVSLANNGVLVLDEINLFSKIVLESLREPFEEQKVMISRARYKVILPSSFLLFMISNLCACGNYGSSKRTCVCSEIQRQNFLSHISGALKDRIDITFILDDNVNNKSNNIDTKTIKDLVIKSFEKQFYRYLNSETKFNGKVYKTELKKYIKIDGELEFYLNDFMKKNGQSFRKMEKVIKVARTIADIENHSEIQKTDLIEAIFFVTGLKNLKNY